MTEEQQDREKMYDMARVISDELIAMVRLTCIVNLRLECLSCISGRVEKRLESFLYEHGKLMESDFDQFMRQVVIWGKEEAEKELKESCVRWRTSWRNRKTPLAKALL